ncbi:lactose permease [Pseudoneurospora amorphoporcata]|uniref:Lactose permease n=1 Tax=Pseudoneurospora amorphoporcata TaxID=241081 RepID=A0AAN6NQN7_9PEZI|nr:lactose permease [Pseudoneurospora amorphoporcata]
MAPKDTAAVSEADLPLTALVKSDTMEWYHKAKLRWLYVVLFFCCYAAEWASGMDSAVMNSIQALPAWKAFFDNPEMGALGLLTSIHAAFSTNTSMFLASRWLLGFGIPFSLVNSSALLAELAHPNDRPTLTSLFNATWSVGAILAAAVTYAAANISGNWSWRLPSLLQIVPSVLQLIFLQFCPESPRWLTSKDRHGEAWGIMMKYHSEGTNGKEFARIEHAQIASTLAEEQRLKSPFIFGDIFRDAPIRKRFGIAAVVGFFTQWSGNALISFYTPVILNAIGITDGTTQQLIILGWTCWGLVVAVPMSAVVPRFGGRTMFLCCTTGATLVYIVWTVSCATAMSDKTLAAAIPVLVAMFLYTPAYSMGWDTLTYTYISELFPFHQRSQGLAMTQITSRFALFLNLYVNPIAISKIGWKYFVVYCVWITIETITVYFCFPETQGKTLEELSFMWEDDEVRDRVRRRFEHRFAIPLRELGPIKEASEEDTEEAV